MVPRQHLPLSPEGLRPGRNVLLREEVGDIQRTRILSAMVQVAARDGYIGAAVAPVVARAGVSRRTFYELYEGREDCFLEAFEWGVGLVRDAMTIAAGGERTWRARVRAALAALLALLDSEPEMARVLVIEALGAGRLVLERRSQVLRELVGTLDEDAPRPRGGGDVLLLSAEGVVGGAFSVIHGRLLEHEIVKDMGPLVGLHGQLMALIALPYLGSRAAGEELTRPAPEPPGRESDRPGDERGRLLDRLDMRLTYRTARCIVFIGEQPGSSNREVAKGADVPDEGQVSKLLGRLARLELIANTKPHGPGYPNSWSLTPQGERVCGSMRGSGSRGHAG